MTSNSVSFESSDNSVTRMPLWRRLAMITSLAIGLFYTARIATKPVPVNAASVEAAAGGYTTFTRKIEDVRPGDLVLSRDEHGTTIAPRPVKEVYRRTSYHLRHLTFRDNAGNEQTLQTTDEHPFWSVTDDAFVDAGKLELGAKVTSPDGDLQTLIATTREECPNGVAVLNFQVDGFHTYYVAQTSTATPFLVHNSNCNDFIPTQVMNSELGDMEIVDSISQTMRSNGGWGSIPPILVHTADDGVKYIVDGHHRVEAARLADIDVQWVEAGRLRVKSLFEKDF